MLQYFRCCRISNLRCSLHRETCHELLERDEIVERHELFVHRRTYVLAKMRCFQSLYEVLDGNPDLSEARRAQVLNLSSTSIAVNFTSKDISRTTGRHEISLSQRSSHPFMAHVCSTLRAKFRTRTTERSSMFTVKAHQILELLVQGGVGELVLFVCIKYSAMLLDEPHDGNIPLRRSQQT